MATTYQNEICPKCGEVNGHRLGCDYDEIEEIADVEIMLAQLKVMFGFNDFEIIAYKQKKLRRLEEMLELEVEDK